MTYLLLIPEPILANLYGKYIFEGLLSRKYLRQRFRLSNYIYLRINNFISIKFLSTFIEFFFKIFGSVTLEASIGKCQF